MNGVLMSSRIIMFRDMLPPRHREVEAGNEDGGQGFPTLEQVVRLSRYVGSEDAGAALLTMEVLNFQRIVLLCGDEIAFGFYGRLLDETERLFRDNYENCRILFVEVWGLGESALFFEHPKWSPYELARAYGMLRMAFEALVKKATVPVLEEPLDAVLGYAELGPARRKDIPRSIVKGLCEARQFALGSLDEKTLDLQREFLALVEEGTIVPVYQPILDFSSGETLGWEAFSRGPANSSFSMPSTFFRFAEHMGGVYELDQRCREMALANLGPVEPGQKIFINTHPMSLNNGLFAPDHTVESLKKFGLKPENVVLEFSENLNLTSPAHLRQALTPYRQLGFNVAVDDVGGGQSSLALLSQVQPDFIKLDASMVRGVDADPFKRLMIEALICLAKKIQARVIAVGLESETEFSSIVSMGVLAGQGFLLSGPEAEKKEVTVQVPTVGSYREIREAGWKCSKPVLEMAESALTVPPDMTIEEVKEILKDKSPNSNVVVVDGPRPVGQLMNYNLDRRLGTRYGISLYLHREVSHLMNRNPLVVDGEQSVEEVAKMAMKRRGPEIYDDIIVTRNTELLGTVSVQRMLDYLAQFQVELAKGTNPLTGLSGNLAIEHEIERRMKFKIPSSLIYIDLDNFKVYNDVYGFGKGDQIILLTSNILQEAIKETGRDQDFIGHVGGDDFIIVSAHERAEAIGQFIMERFEEEAPKYYNEEHRKTGCITAIGRDGIRREFGFVSVSIGIIDFDFQGSFTLNELSERAAMVKKFAKSKWGNSCVRDRRSPLGSAG
ncbi:MAG: EAL and GGDEF domain-containing protein [Proteobacteria bacterium]|nr:EAL and GGDEF domain-containing protein [Pseudomonadota bacterium]